MTAGAITAQAPILSQTDSQRLGADLAGVRSAG